MARAAFIFLFVLILLLAYNAKAMTIDIEGWGKDVTVTFYEGNCKGIFRGTSKDIENYEKSKKPDRLGKFYEEFIEGAKVRGCM